MSRSAGSRSLFFYTVVRQTLAFFYRRASPRLTISRPRPNRLGRILFSQDPFVVFSSNLFAIMALRSIYVIIAQAVNNLPYLKPAVALVLGFVGCKMVLEFGGVAIGTGVSLLVVAFIIGGGIVLSLCARIERRAPVLRHKRRRSEELGTGTEAGEAKGGASDAFV